MAITEQDLAEAEARMATTREGGYAVRARYDRHRGRIVVRLNSGVEVTFPTQYAEGLAGASPDQLGEIEISPAGLGLHWPKLDADLYVPALLQGVLGSKQWMAREVGAKGDRTRSAAKASTALSIGSLVGRPGKIAAGQ